MPISAKWKHKSSIHIGFIAFNGGVTTFFAKSVARLTRTVSTAITKGPQMYVRFKTDPWATKKGFKLSYMAAGTGCVYIC